MVQKMCNYCEVTPGVTWTYIYTYTYIYIRIPNSHAAYLTIPN